MPRTRPVTALCGLLLLSATLTADGPFRSGLQPEERIPSAFHPLNVTGEHAGKEHCLVCENGLNPVVMIFAREVSEPLTRLLARVDAATVKHRDKELGSFVVFLGDREGLQARLEKVGRQKALRHTVLSIDSADGPEGYKLTKAADVTVVLYVEHLVRASHAFKKGELTDKDIDRILNDLPRILPKK
ncbi:MAG: hypothetical protein L0Z62_39980 [Gemmataceae bacterium]|nr:hypothetical protein [Gemmataceae bacterium]